MDIINTLINGEKYSHPSVPTGNWFQDPLTDTKIHECSHGAAHEMNAHEYMRLILNGIVFTHNLCASSHIF